MFKVSKMADYGLLIMVYFARHDEASFNAKSIAEKLHLNLPTASKLLKMLAASGLLTSQRGARGGYSLARPADAIPMVDILSCIEGDMALTECSRDEHQCSLEAVCSTTSHWQIINRAIVNTLASISLQDLLQPHYKLSMQQLGDVVAATEQGE